MGDDPIQILDEKLLSDAYFPLKEVKYAQRRASGERQEETREVYASDSGVTALLYNRARRTVLLTRQFRIGARLSGHQGFLIETAAGMLEGADPKERMRAEIREELGYAVDDLRHVMTLFASPGTLTERVHYFVGEYEPGQRCSEGGGKEDEGEDIDVLEIGFDEAFAMLARGEIEDAKTVVLLQYLQLQVADRSV
ncbi:NUDIX domain-containing protein [Massilia sp. Dwa41.01b]|uniref:NUDIX domain-containing protein n=1 Tax=unclassified Massilia TaxID=2609279 RepID=UPI0016019F32|nr:MULTISPECIES: NUDIX domain-containing protein [unclassified Massilia]QNA88550.1 NUDIX domain-containing protein [Massilia sp. Dwa41.01b]QNA99448.1 NUDIX domain-containing protein [Massilia sp. Se16.2.3]